MNETKINREYKDTVFRKLFSEKENALELYNAINGTNYGPETDFSLETLDNAIYIERKNDVAFTINKRLIIFKEMQSTINPNMPFRSLDYIDVTPKSWT